VPKGSVKPFRLNRIAKIQKKLFRNRERGRLFAAVVRPASRMGCYAPTRYLLPGRRVTSFTTTALQM
jgi:hypothetical protein